MWSLLHFIILIFSCTYGAAQDENMLISSRAATCGDGILQNGEVCDDGNNLAFNGCSSSCTLEPGYMCYNSLRSTLSDATAIGVKVSWSTANPSTLTPTAIPESCTAEQICKQDTIAWQPGLWEAVYNRSSAQLPPAGFYCATFCEETFEAPPGHEFKNSCQPRPVDECIRGLTTCDKNAYCLEPPDGIGYSC